MNGELPGGGVASAISDMAQIESRLAAKLREAASEVAHTETFDQEQRAEIYTILQAMRQDTEIHEKLVGRWVNDATGEASDV